MSLSTGFTRAEASGRRPATSEDGDLFSARCSAHHALIIPDSGLSPASRHLFSTLLTLVHSSASMEQPSLCLCFPCILHYLDAYIYPTAEHQFYPVLQRKGFTREEQAAIAEEWYWIAFERETAVKDYMNGDVTFTDGCIWRRPPLSRPTHASTPGPSSSSSSRSTTSSR